VQRFGRPAQHLGQLKDLEGPPFLVAHAVLFRVGLALVAQGAERTGVAWRATWSSAQVSAMNHIRSTLEGTANGNCSIARRRS
jgi:hypothetical protein